MRPEKQLLLDEVKNQIQEAPGFVLMSYQKMDPNVSSALRGAIAETGGFLYVIKKRVFLKAAQEAGLQVDEDTLKGHLGIVYSGEDTVAVTKTIYKYIKDYKDMLEVLGARFEGKMCSPQEVEQISNLPSKDQMRAEFLGTLEAPMSATLSAVEALLTSIIFCLENKQKKDEAV